MEIRTIQDLAAAARGRRHALKWTQAALANEAGVSRTFVADLEAGKLTVELRSVIAVLDALGITLGLTTSDNDTSLASEDSDATAALDLDQILQQYDRGPT